MASATFAEFSSEHIAEHAQENLTAFILTTFAYLKDHGLSADKFVQYVGHRFAPSWDEVKGHSVQEITRLAALNVVSSGARLLTLCGDHTSAGAVIVGWPPPRWRSAFGLTWEDLDPFWNVYQPIAAHLQLTYTWSRHDDVITFRFTRASKT